MKLLKGRMLHNIMSSLLLTLLVLFAQFSLDTLFPGNASQASAHRAVATPNIGGDPVEITPGLAPPQQEDPKGHETFLSADATVNIPTGWTVLFARNGDLAAPASVYVDDIMTVTTALGNFSYDSSGGCTNAHQYLNADVSDPKQQAIVKLFKVGANSVHLDLKDGCGDGHSPNSKFSTPIWAVPVLNCGGGRVLTSKNVNDEVSLAVRPQDQAAILSSPCDQSTFSATTLGINDTGVLLADALPASDIPTGYVVVPGTYSEGNYPPPDGCVRPPQGNCRAVDYNSIQGLKKGWDSCLVQGAGGGVLGGLVGASGVTGVLKIIFGGISKAVATAVATCTAGIYASYVQAHSEGASYVFFPQWVNKDNWGPASTWIKCQYRLVNKTTLYRSCAPYKPS